VSLDMIIAEFVMGCGKRVLRAGRDGGLDVNCVVVSKIEILPTREINQIDHALDHCVHLRVSSLVNRDYIYYLPCRSLPL